MEINKRYITATVDYRQPASAVVVRRWNPRLVWLLGRHFGFFALGFLYIERQEKKVINERD